jgi:hypothetical protein
LPIGIGSAGKEKAHFKFLGAFFGRFSNEVEPPASPCKLGGQNSQTDGDHDNGGPRQNDHGNADQEYRQSDNQYNNTFGVS